MSRELERLLEDISRSVVWLERRTEQLAAQEGMVRGCRVLSTSTTQNLTTGVLTALTFTTAIYDTDSLFSTTNPTRLTASIAGYYMAGGGWTLSPADVSSGGMGIALRLTGGTYLAGQRSEVVVGEAAIMESVTGMFAMSTSDYVEIMAIQTMTTTKTVLAATSSNQNNCYGWLAKID